MKIDIKVKLLLLPALLVIILSAIFTMYTIKSERVNSLSILAQKLDTTLIDYQNTRILIYQTLRGLDATAIVTTRLEKHEKDFVELRPMLKVADSQLKMDSSIKMVAAYSRMWKDYTELINQKNITAADKEMVQIVKNMAIIGAKIQANIESIVKNASETREQENDFIYKALTATLLLAVIIFAALVVYVIKNEELKRSEAEHNIEIIANSVEEGIFVIDENGVITYANSSASEMLGFAIDEMIGSNAHKLFHHTHPDGSFYPQSECQQKICIQQTGHYNSDDELVWRKNNTPLSVSVNSKSLIVDNKAVGSVMSFHDITHSKMLEEQLRTSNQIIYKVLNNIDAEINVIDIDTNEIIFSNNKSRQKYGELVGKNCF
ncbi:MAG: hypothetical protein RL154_1063, partial [Pseudomonadota bacterium]